MNMLKKGDASPLVGNASGESWTLAALMSSAAGLIACQSVTQTCLVPLTDPQIGKTLKDFEATEVAKI